MVRCPIMSGTAAPSFSPSARNRAASPCATSPLKFMKLTIHWPKRAESSSEGSSGGSPSRSACSINALTWATAALVSGAPYPLTCMSVFNSATCKMICSRRRSDVLGKVAICARAWLSCSAASTSAERSCDRCPALPHRRADFSIRSAFA